MKVVNFIKHHSPYNKGDGALFTDAIADALVKAGVAEYQDKEKPQPKTKTDTETGLAKKVPVEITEK
jgi:hypothetical protein